MFSLFWFQEQALFFLHLYFCEEPETYFLKGNRKGRKLFDQFFTLGMSFFESFYLGKLLWDINAQPTIFHKSFLNFFENPPIDFSLDLFVFYLAKSNNFNIIRIPVFFPERKNGESSWNKNFFSKIRFIKRTISYSIKLKKTL